MRTSKTHASTPRDVELTRLEGFLSSDQSATKEDAAWIRKQLRAARASIVVLTGRADKDRAVRRELKALGLKRDKAMGGHRIYVRAGKGGKRGRASTEPPATPATTASEPAQAP